MATPSNNKPTDSMKYQRVLLKLSGESLMGDQQHGIDPERLKTVDESTKSIMRNKGKRFASYLEIREKYDESKSKSENAEICGVSESTIARFRRNRVEMEQLCSSCFGL